MDTIDSFTNQYWSDFQQQNTKYQEYDLHPHKMSIFLLLLEMNTHAVRKKKVIDMNIKRVLSRM